MPRKGTNGPKMSSSLRDEGQLSNAPWRMFGSCFGHSDPEVFFLGVYEDEAKAICEPCPVKALCLEYGLVYGEYGIWGGLNGAERNKIVKDRKRQKRAS